MRRISSVRDHDSALDLRPDEQGVVHELDARADAERDLVSDVGRPVGLLEAAVPVADARRVRERVHVPRHVDMSLEGHLLVAGVVFRLSGRSPEPQSQAEPEGVLRSADGQRIQTNPQIAHTAVGRAVVAPVVTHHRIAPLPDVDGQIQADANALRERHRRAEVRSDLILDDVVAVAGIVVQLHLAVADVADDADHGAHLFRVIEGLQREPPAPPLRWIESVHGVAANDGLRTGVSRPANDDRGRDRQRREQMEPGHVRPLSELETTPLADALPFPSPRAPADANSPASAEALSSPEGFERARLFRVPFPSTRALERRRR